MLSQPLYSLPWSLFSALVMAPSKRDTGWSIQRQTELNALGKGAGAGPALSSARRLTLMGLAVTIL